jgi:hypothetical protein
MNDGKCFCGNNAERRPGSPPRQFLLAGIAGNMADCIAGGTDINDGDADDDNVVTVKNNGERVDAHDRRHHTTTPPPLPLPPPPPPPPPTSVVTIITTMTITVVIMFTNTSATRTGISNSSNISSRNDSINMLIIKDALPFSR